MAVNDWRPGDKIPGELVAVRDVQIGSRGSKGPQLTATVFDATGSRTAKYWSPISSQIEIIQEATANSIPLVRVVGSIDKGGQYAGELTLDSVSRAEPGEGAIDDYLQPLPADHDRSVATLDRFVNGIADYYYGALLQKMIGPNGKYRTEYTTACAAKKNHHAERGGLLRHSLEVTEFALAMGSRYPEIRRDLVVCAGLLHDFGKVWEMEHGLRQGQYTGTGTMHGHIFLGAEWISNACRCLRFPDDLRVELIHIILSHHDELSFGSPIRPMTGEAILIAKSDQVSAEMDTYRQTVRSVSQQSTVWRGDRLFYVSSFGKEASLMDSVPLPDDPEERLLRRMGERPLESFGTVRLSILGTVAAGDGVRSSEESGDVPERDVVAPPGGADYLLRVTGDSMTGAGILAGDLLLVRQQESARLGQIVVAYVPGSGPVVKTLAVIEGKRVLQSENPAYPPIPVTQETRIQGVVVRIERDF